MYINTGLAVKTFAILFGNLELLVYKWKICWVWDNGQGFCNFVESLCQGMQFDTKTWTCHWKVVFAPVFWQYIYILHIYTYIHNLTCWRCAKLLKMTHMGHKIFKAYRLRKVDYLLPRHAHPKNIDVFGWFINILVHLFNLFQIRPSSNFKHQKIVSLSKIRMFPTSMFCQCVELNLCWTNWGSVSYCFFKQLNIAAYVALSRDFNLCITNQNLILL